MNGQSDEKALSIPSAETISPSRPSRERATLSEILRTPLRALLWLLHGYRLVTLAIIMAFITFFVAIFGVETNIQPDRFKTILIVLAGFMGISLIGGLLNGAAQGIYREGLSNWLVGCDLDNELNLPQNWMAVLIGQAILTGLFAAAAGPPTDPPFISATTQKILFWCAAPGFIILGGVALRWAVFGLGELKETIDGSRQIMTVITAAYRHFPGSLFQKMKFVVEVCKTFDETTYPHVREPLPTDTPALRFLKKYAQRLEDTEIYQEARQDVAASSSDKWVQERLKRLDTLRQEGDVDEEWVLEQLRCIEEEVHQRGEEKVRQQKANYEGSAYARTSEKDADAIPKNEPYIEPPSSVHRQDARGFAQIFGLHPAIAVLIFIVDWMTFAADWGTLGAFWPISIGLGMTLGFITYRAQMKWYGDDKESAFIKAAILAVLVAIPAPIPGILSVPTGIIGLFHRQKS